MKILGGRIPPEPPTGLVPSAVAIMPPCYKNLATALNLQQVLQFLLCFILNLREVSEYKSPEACIWRGDLMEGFFLRYEFGGAIFGGVIHGGGLFSQFYGGLVEPCEGFNNQFGTTSLHFRCKNFVKLMRMLSFAGFSKKPSS